MSDRTAALFAASLPPRRLFLHRARTATPTLAAIPTMLLTLVHAAAVGEVGEAELLLSAVTLIIVESMACLRT